MFKRISIILVSLFVSGILLLFFYPLPPLLQGVSFSQAVYDDNDHLMRLTLSQDEKFRLFTPLKKIAPTLLEATLLQEDQYFYNHYGINPIALVKAYWQTYVLKSRRVGASTITMQLARIRYHINSKTPMGKLEQIVRALQIELHYSKRQILQAYLNLAPYGGNVEGVEAASFIYFNKSAKKLTLPEALTLAVIPQNPRKRNAQYVLFNEILAHFFVRWLQVHPEDRQQQVLFHLPIVMRSRQDLPFWAPHLVNSVLQANNRTQQNINTTVNSKIQKLIERITEHYLSRKRKFGVDNAAVVVLDTRDMAVKALIGSADFFNKQIGGQINGVAIKRSPGSTLKPFIYALALDQGLIHPNTVLKDVPQSFNGYNPENFDYDFMGPIKAKDALVLSRNVPAVSLSSQLASPNLYQLLEQAQVANLKSEALYGLSINLGGAELTMEELVSLYAMLVNEGLWYPIHYQKQQKKPLGRRLISPEAAYLVLDMLKVPKENYAYKTGTSSGFRDAWTMGTVGPYVIGIWLGNFDNSYNTAFIGKELAAPLYLELVQGFKHELGITTMIMPNPQNLHLQRIEVCKASGMLPTPYCTDTESTWFIPGKSPIKTDTIYREVAINNKTGLRTCHINQDTHFEIYEFWPSDLLAIFKKAGIQRHTPPFFEDDCSLSATNGLSPQISSPQMGISYVLRMDKSAENTIPFSAVTDAGIGFLYWFVNDSFIAKVKADEVYHWQAQPGRYVVRVVDDHGLADVKTIFVSLL